MRHQIIKNSFLSFQECGSLAKPKYLCRVETVGEMKVFISGHLQFGCAGLFTVLGDAIKKQKLLERLVFFCIFKSPSFAFTSLNFT